MELLTKVKEIFESHPFSNIDTSGYKNVYELIKSNPDLVDKFTHPTLNDYTLIEKYKSYIPRGWYGFSIGTPVIPVWMEIIDEILELYRKNDPNFEINQIKMKFGRIDFYVQSETIDDKWPIFQLISSTLKDPALIY